MWCGGREMVTIGSVAVVVVTKVVCQWLQHRRWERMATVVVVERRRKQRAVQVMIVV